MGMARTFRDALIWHLDRHKTSITDLARSCGVSRDVINNIIRREDSSTSVERAIAIASYYGESVEQFLACGVPNNRLDVVARLIGLITPDELKMLESQLRGLISSRKI
jgi:transcriptional regulator with XRE-family HTH domain